MLDATPWPAGIELGYRSAMPLIELKLIGHSATRADMEAAEARLLAAIQPWLVGRGNDEPAQQILTLLGDKPLTLLEGRAGVPCLHSATIIPAGGSLQPPSCQRAGIAARHHSRLASDHRTRGG